VKPNAMSMVMEFQWFEETKGLPISGIGGSYHLARCGEFITLGWGNVQVCTAAMTYGFKIVQE
jgi:dihydropyrimidine dehydrogenase (NAD+) subunit PreA